MKEENIPESASEVPLALIGEVTNVRSWDRALTEAEILREYEESSVEIGEDAKKLLEYIDAIYYDESIDVSEITEADIVESMFGVKVPTVPEVWWLEGDR